MNERQPSAFLSAPKTSMSAKTTVSKTDKTVRNFIPVIASAFRESYMVNVIYASITKTLCLRIERRIRCSLSPQKQSSIFVFFPKAQVKSFLGRKTESISFSFALRGMTGHPHMAVETATCLAKSNVSPTHRFSLFFRDT